MAAPKGNSYWKLVKNAGRPKTHTPESLWNKALEYAEWCEVNPLYEKKAFGTGLVVDIPHMRTMTIQGLCLFSNISHLTFLNYEKEDDFLKVTTRIRDLIFTQKFEGAAADMLNPNIIARDLGLVDKSRIEHELPADGELIQAARKRAEDILNERKK